MDLIRGSLLGLRQRSVPIILMGTACIADTGAEMGGSKTSASVSTATSGTQDTAFASTNGSTSSTSSTSSGSSGGSIECDEFSSPFENHDMSYGTSIYLANNRSSPILWVFGDPCIQDVSPAFWVESVDGGVDSPVCHRCRMNLCDDYVDVENAPECPPEEIYGILVAPGATTHTLDGGDLYVWWFGDLLRSVEMPQSCVKEGSMGPPIECNLREDAALGDMFRIHAWASEDLNVCKGGPCACSPGETTCVVEIDVGKQGGATLHAESEIVEFWPGIVDIVFSE